MDRTKLSGALTALYDLVARLRGPGGCPWDARQTDATIKMYLLEECYEVLDAVERGEPRQVSQELGDLLFQVLFLAYLAEEREEFDLLQVLLQIHEKMVRRHPHVFGNGTAKTPEEVSLNWARIKENERGVEEDHASPLKSVPLGLPALLRAHRLGERASKLRGGAQDGRPPFDSLERDLRGLKEFIAEADTARIGEWMGRLLFDLACLARSRGLNAEDLLRHANQQFVEDFTTASAKDEGR